MPAHISATRTSQKQRKKMIGLFNDNFPPILDGVALTVRNYADCMHQLGKDVCVVTAKAPHEAYDLPYPVYPYSSFPIPMRKPYRAGLPQLNPKLVHQVFNQPLEIIHAHCPFATGKFALQVAAIKKIPVVGTFHSKYRQDFERVVPLKPVVDAMLKPIVSFYEHCDEVWVPQASVAPVLEEYGYKGRIEVMDNGNDMVSPTAEVKRLREIRRKDLGLKSSDTMLLFVGQHIWEKNIGFILEAMALLKAHPCHLYMIGIGYAAEDIRKKILELDIADKVTMLGSVQDRELLKSYYAAADLFLFPSLYDNAPLVVREAAAMHTPTVMLSGSTSAEIIQSGYNGFLTSNDKYQYVNTIKYLMAHPESMQTAGDNASMTIARSWEDVVKEVLQRYEAIIRLKKK